MMETNPRGGYDQPQSQLTLQIIWFAMLFAVVLYGVVAWFVVGAGEPTVRWTEMPVLALIIAGVVVLFSAFFIPSLLVRRGAGDQSGMRVTPAYAVSSRVRMALIIRFALIEASAVFGLIGAFLGQSGQLYLPLGALALLAMLLSFPSDSLIRRLDSE